MAFEHKSFGLRHHCPMTERTSEVYLRIRGYPNQTSRIHSVMQTPVPRTYRGCRMTERRPAQELKRHDHLRRPDLNLSMRDGCIIEKV